MRRAWIPICCIGLVFLASCQNSEPSTVVIDVPSGFAAENQVERLELRVTAPDITPISATLMPPFGPSRDFNVQVPKGTERVFTVTAILSTTSTAGFIGAATSNIDQGLHTIPITMNFVNFAEDLSDDGIQANPTDHPELTELSLELDNDATICANEDAVFITIQLDDRYANYPIGPRFIIEFDRDADTTTGSRHSFISQNLDRAGAPFTTAFVQGTERFILIDADNRSPNGIFNMELHAILADDSTTLLTSGPNSPLFEAMYDTNLQTLTLCLAESFFNNPIDGIDDDGLGTFNVLTGYLSDVGQFHPNDMAFTSGAIIYDFSFDTSGL